MFTNNCRYLLIFVNIFQVSTMSVVNFEQGINKQATYRKETTFLCRENP